MVSYMELEDWLLQVSVATNPVVLVMDEIEDVSNFGAILRTAAAAGVQAVIVPKHRQAPVNATVFKTSAGAAGRIPIIRVTNTNQSLQKLKDAGFWVAGLDQHAETPLWKQNLILPLAVIVGSEGEGHPQKNTGALRFYRQPAYGHRVESLNASGQCSAALLRNSATAPNSTSNPPPLRI